MVVVVVVVVVVGTGSQDSLSSVARKPSLHLQVPLSVQTEFGVTFSQSSAEKHLLPSATKQDNDN